MQKFSQEIHQKFQEYFQIQKQETEREKHLYKKTEQYLKYIKWIPGLKMIGVGNSLSMNCTKPGSDIDLYIVATKNRIWLVRICITFIFQILGVRKTGKKHAERFCLSFFSTLEGMDFGKFALKDDVYLYFWIVYFTPLLDFDATYDLFLEKNKSWADLSEYENILQENKTKIKYTKTAKKKKKTPFLSTIVHSIFDCINNCLKKIFLPKTLKTFETLGKPFGVIISSDVMKFHNGDIRKEVQKKILGKN